MPYFWVAVIPGVNRGKGLSWRLFLLLYALLYYGLYTCWEEWGKNVFCLLFVALALYRNFLTPNLKAHSRMCWGITIILWTISPPTCEPSSCYLSKMQKCVCLSNHVNEFTGLAYSVMCMHLLQAALLLCILLYSPNRVQ